MGRKYNVKLSTKGRPAAKEHYGILLTPSISVIWACADNGAVLTETSPQCNSCKTGRTLGAVAPSQDILYSKTISTQRNVLSATAKSYCVNSA